MTKGQTVETEPITERGSAPVTNQELGIITRKRARKARTQEANGLLMPLHITGGMARVKRLSLADRVAMGQLPDGMQQRVIAALGRPQARTPLEMDRNRKETLEFADQFCIIGFIQPRIVATPDEVDENDDYCLCVTDLHPEERLSYFFQSVGRDVGESARFRAIDDGAPE